MNNLDKNYQDLLQDILENGVPREYSDGNKNSSVFGKQFIHEMSEGFPLLTLKKILFKNIATELIWHLRGETSVKFLLNNNFNSYNSKLYEKFLDNQKELPEEVKIDEEVISFEKFIDLLKKDEKFLQLHGDFISTFGKQLRRWNEYEEYVNISYKNGVQDIESGFKKINIDQLYEVIQKIRKNNQEDSIFVNCWNVAEIKKMLIPLNYYGFQIFCKKLSFDERLKIFLKYNNVENLESINEEYLNSKNISDREISLMCNQKSTDVFSEFPINLAFFGLLLHILSIVSGMIPGRLILNLGEAYLKEENKNQALEELKMEPYKLCNLITYSETWLQPDDRDKKIDDFINSIKVEHFLIRNYLSHNQHKL